jgi:hypothetical protein
MLLGPQASTQIWELKDGFGRKQPPWKHSRSAGQPSLVLQTQPRSGSQTWPSRQLSAGPPTQVPSWQVSSVVQAVPSSQGVSVKGIWRHSPVARSHVAWWQSSWGLQTTGVPTQ